MSSTKPKPPTTRNPQLPKRANPLLTAYLLAYNFLSTALWFGVLYRVVRIGGKEVLNGQGFGGEVFRKSEDYVKWTQTLAGLEVLHSALGLVRSPLPTTLMQVSSRFLLVWGICHAYPSLVQPSPAYNTMLLAWSITEVIRYSYFVFVLSGTGVPALWQWLRYNTFLVLYPLGVGSETWLVGRVARFGEAVGAPDWVRWGCWAVLGVYVPGFYVLFTHMLKQRRRIVSAKTA